MVALFANRFAACPGDKTKTQSEPCITLFLTVNPAITIDTPTKGQWCDKGVYAMTSQWGTMTVPGILMIQGCAIIIISLHIVVILNDVIGAINLRKSGVDG